MNPLKALAEKTLEQAFKELPRNTSRKEPWYESFDDMELGFIPIPPPPQPPMDRRIFTADWESQGVDKTAIVSIVEPLQTGVSFGEGRLLSILCKPQSSEGPPASVQFKMTFKRPYPWRFIAEYYLRCSAPDEVQVSAVAVLADYPPVEKILEFNNAALLELNVPPEPLTDILDLTFELKQKKTGGAGCVLFLENIGII